MAPVAPAAEPPRILALEKELAGPNAAEALARYDAVLLGLEARAKAAVDAGLPPEEFDRVAALRDANVIARKILRLAVRDGGTNQN